MTTAPKTAQMAIKPTAKSESKANHSPIPSNVAIASFMGSFNHY